MDKISNALVVRLRSNHEFMPKSLCLKGSEINHLECKKDTGEH